MININKIKKGKLIEGDCLEELARIPSDSIDQVITDPPYGLKYYGSDWDKQVPPVAAWEECLRVLKPGGFAFIMSSPRQDVLSKMISNLERAGFHTRFTSLYWTYLTGFAHRYKCDLAVDKKLGVESKIIETKIQKRVKFKLARDLGCKGQFCDKSKVEYHVKEANSELGKKIKGAYTGFHPKPTVEVVLVVMKPLSEKSYVNQAIFNRKGITFQDDCAIPIFNNKNEMTKRGMSNIIVSDNALDQFESEIEFKDNKGNSFRFSLDAWAKYTLPCLFVAKPSQAEKDFGLDALPTCNINDQKPGQVGFNVPGKLRTSDRKNNHKTVKPLKLMTYLTVLGSRPGDLVLDPFCGSGTTCVSAMLLGRKFIGIEKEPEYLVIAKERLLNCRMAPEH